MVLPPLAELRRRYVQRGRPLPAEVEAQLRADPRAGVRQLLASIERRRREHRSEGQRLRKMHRFEEQLWSRGLTLVAGVDEVGMSPLAGPVAAAAVILPVGCRVRDIDDSKKLDAKTRGELAEAIREVAVAWCVAFVEPDEIDRINIYWAGMRAMELAVMGLSCTPEYLLIDARKLKAIALPQKSIVHGDTLSASIAAASILAKTARDAHMCELDRIYPGYGLSRHKGYPVREHRLALARLGACPIHRRSFALVRKALGLPPLGPDHWKLTREAPESARSMDPRSG